MGRIGDGMYFAEVADLMNSPPHPADFLNEVLLPATGRSDAELARLLGVPLEEFYTILTRERPIATSTAKMLGRLFGTGEGFWLKMQAEYNKATAPQIVVDLLRADGPLPARPRLEIAAPSLRRLPGTRSPDAGPPAPAIPAAEFEGERAFT